MKNLPCPPAFTGQVQSQDIAAREATKSVSCIAAREATKYGEQIHTRELLKCLPYALFDHNDYLFIHPLIYCCAKD